MFDHIVRLRNYIIARRRGQINARDWLDIENKVETLRKSSVPGVVMLAILWMTCTVLLTLSFHKQHNVDGFEIGKDRIPNTIKARSDFSYFDTKKRDAAAAAAPLVFSVDKERDIEIVRRFNDFFQEVIKRNQAAVSNRKYEIEKTQVKDLVEKCSPELVSLLVSEYPNGDGYRAARERFMESLRNGVLSSAQERKSGVKVKIKDKENRLRREELNITDIPSAANVGERVKDMMFKDRSEQRLAAGEFAAIISEIIGSKGNLVCDVKATEDMKDKILSELKKNGKLNSSCKKGDEIAHKGDVYTEHIKIMLDAERKAAPDDFGVDKTYQHIIWSFILLAVVSYIIIKLYPDLLKDSRQVTVSALVIVISLLINYWTCGEFDNFVRTGRINSQELVIDAVPVVLTSVVLTVLIGYKTAMCASFLVVSITAMMIMPNRSFELAMRWLVTSAVASLAVYRVKNYRSYFMMIFFITIPLVMALSVGAQKLGNTADGFSKDTLFHMFKIACINGFGSAVIAMVLVFAFEIIFNIDTNMALMPLSDLSHPLLERLKREAPGTMSHSLRVSTIAEDAAKEIGANHLRAKVAALFHDIGKLDMPHYFTENNKNSSIEHGKLSPHISSIIIRDHVKEGLALAKKYRLYRWIQMAIATHHGNDLVRYFYHEAKKQQENDSDAPAVLEAQFRYDGEPPRAKELVILSLADACEAATRSLAKPSAANIEALVNKIFLTRYEEGQLSNAEISFAELDKVRKSVIKSLTTDYHGRVAYPEQTNAKDKV